MKAIFDANAIISLATLGSKATRSVESGSSLSLTFFEIGNSVWKLHYLLKKLSPEEAEELLEGSLGLYDKLHPLILGRNDATSTEKLATARKITFYDSCYVYAAKKYGLPLVTEDQKLAKAAKDENVERLTSLELL